MAKELVDCLEYSLYIHFRTIHTTNNNVYEPEYGAGNKIPMELHEPATASG
jgi:hypothetical protein